MPPRVEAAGRQVRVAGRMLAKRVMGKASFVQLQDRSGAIQLFLQGDALGAAYDAFKGWDVGDIVGAEGTLMRTRTGELSVKCSHLALADQGAASAAGQVARPGRRRDPLPPALRRPDVNPESRQVFRQRAALIRCDARLPRGAAARLPRGRDPDDAPHPRRCRGASIRHPPQRAGPGPVPAGGARSCTSSAWWSAASSGSTRSTATSATRASAPATTPNSPCSSSTRPTPATSRSWT